jgi:hypothetical protein
MFKLLVKSSLFLFSISLLYYGCDPVFCELKIENKSGGIVYYGITESNYDKFWATKDDILYFHHKDGRIPAGSSKYDCRQVPYKEIIENRSDKKLHICVIKEEFFKKLQLEKIADTTLFKRYDYTEKELEKLNWTVTYP